MYQDDKEQITSRLPAFHAGEKTREDRVNIEQTVSITISSSVHLTFSKKKIELMHEIIKIIVGFFRIFFNHNLRSQIYRTLD